jgi:hypothetical protein
MKAIRYLAFFAAVGLLGLALTREKKLVVHEWGTFTSLQDETGEAIGGINADDEPVPRFVHRLASGFLIWPRPLSAPYWGYKGGVGVGGSAEPGSTFKVVTTGHCHLDVKLRLETPVVYFYPEPGTVVPPFDVHVTFRGGWLSEYYPDAEARAPGIDAANPDRVFTIGRPNDRVQGFERGFGHLRPEANGELQWKAVKLGVDGAGPETTEKVWLAPRAAPAAMLQTASGEREKFLFYRGVGCGAAGLRIVRDKVQRTLEIRDAGSNPAVASSPIAAAWLVEVQADGRCAFRSLGALPATTQPRATVPAFFNAQDFSGQNLGLLQTEMRASLVKAGLFGPEADALLTTWQVSYFKSPGLRLFYLCPAAEVEAMLPLQISIPCNLTRVMIGRIEIVTPAQREALARIAAPNSPIPNPDPKNPSKSPTGLDSVEVEIPPSSISASVTPKAWANLVFESSAGHPVNTNPENALKAPASLMPVEFGKLPSKPLTGSAIGVSVNTNPESQLGRFPHALLLDEERRRPTAALHEYIRRYGISAYEVQ